MNSSKTDIRNRILDARAKFGSEEVRKRSCKIGKLLQNMDAVTTAKRIGIYLPVKNEVDTKSFIDTSHDKEFYVPKNLKADSDYGFVKFENWDELEAGPHGIMQPQNGEVIDINSLDVIIVPGVAFDKKGMRLGYGAGVYDRLLSGYKGLILGVAYDFQVLNALPYEKHDVFVNYLVTEEKIYKF